MTTGPITLSIHCEAGLRKIHPTKWGVSWGSGGGWVGCLSHHFRLTASKQPKILVLGETKAKNEFSCLERGDSKEGVRMLRNPDMLRLGVSWVFVCQEAKLRRGL